MKKSKKKKSTVISLRVEITNDFNENIETICELIAIALEESSSAPHLAVDGFLIRAHLKCREMLEFN